LTKRFGTGKRRRGNRELPEDLSSCQIDAKGNIYAALPSDISIRRAAQHGQMPSMPEYEGV